MRLIISHPSRALTDLRYRVTATLCVLAACGRVRSADTRACSPCAEFADATTEGGTTRDGASADGSRSDGPLPDGTALDAGPSPFGGDAAWDGRLPPDAASDGYTVLVADGGLQVTGDPIPTPDLAELSSLDPGNVYWMSQLGAVWSVPKAGGATTEWVVDSGSDKDGWLAVYGSNVYWAFEGESYAAPSWEALVPAPAVAPLGDGLGAPNLSVLIEGLAVGSSGVFAKLGVSPLSVQPQPETVLLARLALDGGLATPVATFAGPDAGFAESSGPMLVDDAYAYAAAGGAITRVPLGGGVAVSLATVPQFAVAALAQDAVSLFWIEANTDELRSVPKQGGTPMTLATVETTDSSFIASMVVDDEWVYFTLAPGDSPPGYVARVPKLGGAVVTLSQGGAPRGVAVDDVAVYWLGDPPAVVSRLMKAGL